MALRYSAFLQKRYLQEILKKFLIAAYDKADKTTFFSDKNIMRKKRIFADIRAKLQTKGYGVGQAWAKTYLRAREALDI